MKRDNKREYDFYFTHNTTFIRNLLKILKDGYIKRGMDVSHKHRVGHNKLKEVYCNIQFDDLHNRDNYWGLMLIINPKILEEYNIGLRRGWQGNEDIIKATDSNKTFWKKMDVYHDYLRNINQHLITGTGKKIYWDLNRLHEVVFMKRIPIDKYVDAIICDLLTDEEYDIVKKLVEKKKYNIKLIRRARSQNPKENRQVLKVLPKEKLLRKD